MVTDPLRFEMLVFSPIGQLDPWSLAASKKA
jgi:hypothetical protein